MKSDSSAVKSYGTLAALAVAIVAAGALGSAAVGRIAKAMSPLPDPRYPVDLSAGLALPAPVIRDDNGALLVLALSLGTVVLVCWLGFKLAGGLKQHVPVILAICGTQAIVLLSLSFVAWGVTGDVYQFVLLGRMLERMGLNPYFVSAPLPTADPSTAAMLRYWGNPPPLDVYGPLWTLFAALLSRVTAGASLWVEFLLHRWAAIVAAIVATAGLVRMVSPRMPDQAARRAASLFAFHPLLAFECSVNGHNDMLMIAPAIWSLALAAEHPLVAGLLVGAAAAVKYPAIVLLPFVAAAAWRRRWTAGLSAVAAAAVTIAICFLPFWRGWSTVTRPLAYSGTFETSPTWLAVVALRAIGHAPAPRVFVIIGLCVFAAVAAISIRLYLRDWRTDHIVRTATALVLTLPVLHPWYVEWLTPAIAARQRWGTYAWWFGVLALAYYPLYLLRPPASLTLTHAIVIGTTIFVIVAPVAIALRTRFPLVE